MRELEVENKRERKMSYIHFKSAFGREFDKITFDGVSLSVGEIKKMIAEKCKLSKQLDFDLEITNAETSQGKKTPNPLG